ncbi:MAG: two-component system response regulator [Deltaproteobacteria bacterium GWA2_55_10]|nr:MAG: two-component system response regulator [Deltaproteobacteria bacterium GWA2_55_10]
MSKRVLIADDTEFFRLALKDILGRAGFTIVGEAENGAMALEMAKGLKPDLVILDVVMPVMNGLDAAKAISALKLPLKIVMCTSLGYEPIVEEAVRSGASGYIIKPLSETKVLNTLNSIL